MQGKNLVVLQACHKEICSGQFREDQSTGDDTNTRLNRNVRQWSSNCGQCKAYKKKFLIPDPWKTLVSFRPLAIYYQGKTSDV